MSILTTCLRALPNLQKVRPWDFIKRGLEGSRTRKEIGKEAAQSVEVQGRSLQDVTGVTKEITDRGQGNDETHLCRKPLACYSSSSPGS